MAVGSDHLQHAIPAHLARRYVWWLAPEESLLYPQRIIAAVMDMGTLEDIREITQSVGEDALKDALEHAEPGQFRPRSWSFWHHFFYGLTEEGVPPLPVRKIP